MHELDVRRPHDGARAEDYDPGWLSQHLARERREAELLGETREAIFGAQDGLTSVLAVVTTVGFATGQQYAVLVAGLAAALAGIVSMSAGEYISSKSQREIFEAQIAGEAREIDERPVESEAEVAFLLQEEGLSRESALRVARELAHHKPALLRMMVEKELGLSVEGDGTPARGAAIMGVSFGLGALVPVLPYLFLPIWLALAPSLLLSGLGLFAIGVVKSRWTGRYWLSSGAEVFWLGALAAVAGYVFGSVLPLLLGVAGVSV